MRFSPITIAALGVFAYGTALADERQDKCLLEQLSKADDHQTVAAIKAACAAQTTAQGDANKSASSTDTNQDETDSSLVEQRIKQEEVVYDNPYAITGYRQNYLLLAAYNATTPNSEAFRDQTGDNSANKTEAKFQLSLKFPLVYDQDVWGQKLDWMIAYTQRSFWQVYNKKSSSPFRESNYEPETWVQIRPEWELGSGLKVSALALGINHQSNGRGGDFSRSWNRVMGAIVVDYNKHLAFSLRPWWRIPEDSNNDDNPDITDYLGNFDLLAVYKTDNGHTFDLMVRDNLKLSNNHGAVQLGWSFPLFPHLRGYVQWFYGYGESLIDYNIRQSSIGAGFQFVDW